MGKKKVALDVGYRGVKGFNSEGDVVHFPSLTGNKRKATFSLTGKRTDMEITLEDGSTWFVGETAMVQSEYSAGRADAGWIFSTHYEVLFCMGLARLCRGSSHIPINLVSGLPLQHYEVLATKAAGEVFLGRHTFQNGDQTWQTVVVEDVYLVTQPFGTLADVALNGRGEELDNVFATGTVGICDVGGGTVGLLTVTSLEEVGRWTAGTDLGLLAALANVANDIRADYPGFSPKSHEVAGWLAEGRFPYQDKVIDIEPYARPHLDPLVEVVLSQMSTVWKEPGRLQAVLLTGGGSVVLGHRLVERMRGAYANVSVARDPVFANARGYMKLAHYFWPELGR